MVIKQSKFGRLNRYGRPCNSSIAIRAAIIARGEEGADYPQPSGKQNAQTSNFGKTRITRQKELLTEFAKLSGCWITDFYEQPESFVILNGKTYKYLDEGYENRVYDSEDKTEGRKVLKIIHNGDISVYYYENYREPNPDKLDIHGSVLRYCIHDATINDIRPISPLFDNGIKLLKLIYN